MAEKLVGNPVRDRNQGTLLGADRLLGSTFKKSSVTNPNLLEEGIDALVSRGCSSLEESVGEVFGQKSWLKK